MLVFAIAGKVIAYNLNLKSGKVLLFLRCDSKKPCYHSYRRTYRFIESLSPT
ncbi:hypothetical protein RHMOL_Rhmol03G0274100 [Rhododendron molle]|uniref:Uncharacterized protein n=1 Tax=Rhododendron molle TaxID=49168 RepID=A0ACC0PKR1_RHOML|nr:hypothetical protein RHMOL_Rhmol03G0274100 [Rhododendron molle]